MNEIDHLDSFDVATITTAVSSISITAPAVEPSAIIRLNSCKGNEDIDDTIGIQDVSTVKVSPAKPSKVSKRTDNVICWDEYFMAIAFLSSMRSKDPSTQVGACIVNEDKRIVGIGYNGFPRGCSDDELPWDREADSKFDTKYMYVCHAEVNAILNKNSADVKGCTIFVALFPCNECAKMIIQSGIVEVVFVSDKYSNDEHVRASKRMLTMAGIKQRQYVPDRASISIDFINIPGDVKL